MMLVGAVGGLLGFYVKAWLFRWIGTWMGGQATAAEVRAALAWGGELPAAVGFGLIWPLFVWAGLRTLIDGLSLLLGVYQVLMVCLTLAEVNRFSPWKALVPMSGAVLVVAIPNIWRGRVEANERIAVESLQQAGAALETFKRKSGAYPDSWYRDLYGGRAVLDPALLNGDAQGSGLEAQGYLYRYAPGPNGCGEVTCSTFILSATPLQPGCTGTGRRSFLIDPSGIVRHCLGGTGARRSDARASEAPSACADDAR